MAPFLIAALAASLGVSFAQEQGSGETPHEKKQEQPKPAKKQSVEDRFLEALKKGEKLDLKDPELLKKLTSKEGLALPGKHFGSQEGSVKVRLFGDPNGKVELGVLYKHGDATQDHMETLNSELQKLGEQLKAKGLAMVVVSPMGRGDGADSAKNGERLLNMVNGVTTALGGDKPSLMVMGLSGAGRELNGIARFLNSDSPAAQGLGSRVIKMVNADALAAYHQDDKSRAQVVGMLEKFPNMRLSAYHSVGDGYDYMARYYSKIAKHFLGQGFGLGETVTQGRFHFAPAGDGTHFGALRTGTKELFDGIQIGGAEKLARHNIPALRDLSTTFGGF